LARDEVFYDKPQVIVACLAHGTRLAHVCFKAKGEHFAGTMFALCSECYEMWEDLPLFRSNVMDEINRRNRQLKEEYNGESK